MSLTTALEQLKAQYKAQPYPSLRSRHDCLEQLKRLLQENEASIIDAISQDFSYRAPFETELAEIYPSLKSITYTQKHLPRWAQANKRSVSIWFKPAQAKVMYQPLGVVGIIVPWNYPLFTALGPLIGALAAGNRVMLKMSEFTPKFSRLFALLCEQYLSADWVRVINGGPEVGAAFSRLPFDHLLFTGSSAIGKKVMQAASDHLTPVTLELGGKSPTVIDSDFPLKQAVERLMFGKLLNAGQTCLAPDYAFVHDSQQSKLVELAKQIARKFYPDWQLHGYTAIASDKQLRRYQELVQDARDKGADIIPLLDTEDLKGRKTPPLLVLNTTPEMRVRQEEIFGPLLPLVAYRDHDEVIDWINTQPRPLALYLFSNNKKLTERYMTQTISGGVTLNDTIFHVSQDELPFGGVGASGMGHYHGQEGFKTFSKAKSIFKQSRFAGTKVMYPPHGKLAKLLMALMKR